MSRNFSSHQRGADSRRRNALPADATDSKRLASWLATTTSAIERSLRQTLPADRSALAQAMRHATLSGGKRIRPLLCLATAAIGGGDRRARSAAVAVELIHCYSLVHDDLPALDNDLLRRGRPSTHVKYGEAIAIVAGDALQALAFEIIGKSNIPGATEMLARAAGASGMCKGQAIDLQAEARSERALRRMHGYKTGALFEAAIMIGAAAAAIPPAGRKKLQDFAAAFGLMYQIGDDIADATATAAATGKNTGRDRKLGKATYATILGLPAAAQRHRKAAAAAAAALAAVPGNTGLLAGICARGVRA
ncbi:MAG: polyprenyl synthetase family protein [Betaproteobacteria bacterium]|nr:polyprenyl synthetase family protein [Betaproteobacteria bacterium]